MIADFGGRRARIRKEIVEALVPLKHNNDKFNQRSVVLFASGVEDSSLISAIFDY